MSEEENIPENTKVFTGAGRPPMYSTPEELQEKIESFFANPPDKHKIFIKDGASVDVPIITITGLCLYLGFSDRHSFYDYEKKPEFTHTIKRARTFIEMEYEKMLRYGNCTGAIFALKNFGWVDKTEVDMNAKYQQMPTITKNGKKAVFNVGEPLPEDEISA